MHTTNKERGAVAGILGIIVLVAAIAGLIYFVNQPEGENTPTPVSNDDSMKMPAPMMNITLAAVKNSGQSGTALLKDMNGKTQVSISLTGGTSTQALPAGRQAAHIHDGTCEKTGGIHEPLTPVENGASVTILNEPLSHFLLDLEAGDLYINVHKSETDLAVVACGNIVTVDEMIVQ